MKKRLACLPVIIAAALAACNTPAEQKQQKFIITGYMDSAVQPGDNFYKFVNGKWLDTVQIPSTEIGTGSFLDLRVKTRSNLKTLIEEVSKASNTAGSNEQKVGDFYLSGMDTAAIDKLGYEPVKPYLQKIDAITDTKGILQFVAEQQTENTPLLFMQFIGPDEKNSRMNIPVYYQGGLGLPDRDYYFKTDAATQAIVEAYHAYISKLFMLTGDDSAAAAKKTAAVYELEKQLASSHKTNVELRDPPTNYHKMAVSDLTAQMPVFNWKATMTAMGVNADSVNVGQPAFFAKVNELLTKTPVDTWRAYLRFHLLNESASALSSDFQNASFDFRGKALNGQKQQKPRNERVVQMIDGNLGEALGQLYVKKYFSEDAKQRMMQLVSNLQAAFAARIDKLDWMSDSTKVKAKEKLNTFLKKIGYPDKWKDYSKVQIDKGKYFENLVSCAKNEYQYQVSKVGKSVDRTEWGMSPPTINAYYNPTFNEIVFPAGILQFPFFDPNADDAINYGGIGMVIGHEMTHGFDDQGAQYDKDGNLKNWWSEEDYAKFKAKSQQVINLYNSFTVLDTVHVKGELTNGENIADIGGLAIAYDAFKMTAQGKDTVKIDGFTPDQRFFLSVAQIWRTKLQDKAMLMRINTDPHSPGMYRVLGPLMNFDPFYAAFKIQASGKMYVPDDKRIKIW